MDDLNKALANNDEIVWSKKIKVKTERGWGNNRGYSKPLPLPSKS